MELKKSLENIRNQLESIKKLNPPEKRQAKDLDSSINKTRRLIGKIVPEKPEKNKKPRELKVLAEEINGLIKSTLKTRLRSKSVRPQKAGLNSSLSSAKE